MMALVQTLFKMVQLAAFHMHLLAVGNMINLYTCTPAGVH